MDSPPPPSTPLPLKRSPACPRTPACPLALTEHHRNPRPSAGPEDNPRGHWDRPPGGAGADGMPQAPPPAPAAPAGAAAEGRPTDAGPSHPRLSTGAAPPPSVPPAGPASSSGVSPAQPLAGAHAPPSGMVVGAPLATEAWADAPGLEGDPGLMLHMDGGFWGLQLPHFTPTSSLALCETQSLPSDVSEFETVGASPVGPAPQVCGAADGPASGWRRPGSVLCCAVL